MNGHEIRRKFLEYFERNRHKIVHSAPLLPANDPTLLFTNAGMNQFKDVFLGNEKRDYTRAASSQKCIRAGGKHNDLDEVGKTARHHTFFEMLGNFSFGDYFKRDAIHFAWDFLVNELKLEPQRLWFSYFGGDDEVPADEEARQLWIEVGAAPERVLPFGRKDNFWQMGDEGPCGPCSEIHYYMGDEPENPEKNRADLINADDGDTTMEIWNLVFMQFNRTGVGEKGADGKFTQFDLTPLPAPSVDTGGGLERFAAVLQGVKTNYDTDLVLPIIQYTAGLADRHYEYDTTEGFAMRVVADHARATAFAIADGILPGNEGRNYVLRKIMRRAIYHGREHLGFSDLFFNQVCDFVIDRMKDAYPELEAQRDFIGKMVRLEEERFGNTLTVGLKRLEELMQKRLTTWEVDGVNDISAGTIPLSELAKLYDTYGTPIDLIYFILNTDVRGKHRVSREEKWKVYDENSNHSFVVSEISEEQFRKEFENELREIQKQNGIGQTKQSEKINPIYVGLERTSVRSEFRGYEVTAVENAEVVALIKNDERVEVLNEGDEGLIVLNETPFYAESGGQVGDTGILVSTGSGSDRVISQNPVATAPGTDFRARVLDCFAPMGGIILHKSKVERGSVKVGDTVTAQVDAEKRDATRRNHTATHLVHAALREVLGTHVKQAGSVVAPNYLRFDFTHYQALTESEIKEIETIVNREILKNDAVNTDLMSIEEAMQTGAMALFGEKYGSTVRVLRIGEGAFSKELCGGTHVRATGDIGSFKIVADEAIASGVRRIRAITGFDAFERFREDEKLIEKSLGVLRTQRDQLPTAIEKLQEELKRTRREVEDLKMKIATGAIGNGSANGDEAREINGVKVLAKAVEGLDSSAMRNLSDTLLSKLKSGVVVLGRKDDAKVSFIVRSSEDVKNKIPAGQIIKEIAPIVGGRGGGKPDMAEGGGNQPEKLDEALNASYGVIERLSQN
ncbi:MAG TPA: alanine--tRNA ligase [Pyrinomonadaceae bacterium]|jgi:alanyl-tRNA synthetase